MKKEIHDHGPILCAINFYTKTNGSRAAWTLSSGKTNSDGIFNNNYGDITSKGFISSPSMDGSEYTKDYKQGGHAVMLYGYGTTTSGTKYWEFRNSWGSGYGYNGSSRIIRGVDAWNIENDCYTSRVRDATNI
jgi:C1A family cysteine protease